MQHPINWTRCRWCTRLSTLTSTMKSRAPPPAINAQLLDCNFSSILQLSLVNTPKAAFSNEVIIIETIACNNQLFLGEPNLWETKDHISILCWDGSYSGPLIFYSIWSLQGCLSSSIFCRESFKVFNNGVSMIFLYNQWVVKFEIDSNNTCPIYIIKNISIILIWIIFFKSMYHA